MKVICIKISPVSVPNSKIAFAQVLTWYLLGMNSDSDIASPGHSDMI